MVCVKFNALHLDELLIEYGVKAHQYTSSCCDKSFSFDGIGKRAAFPDITGTFVCLSETLTCISDDNMRPLQRHVIPLYDRTSECSQIDQARKNMFAKGGGPARSHVEGVFKAYYVWLTNSNRLVRLEIDQRCHRSLDSSLDNPSRGSQRTDQMQV